MTTRRTTVMMQTDIRGSTVPFRALPAVALAALRTAPRHCVARLAAAHDGRLVQPEGDGVWGIGPSVTAGAGAAMRRQEEWRLAQPGQGAARLAMRLVLTLGDVWHQAGARGGDAVGRAARLEECTPPAAIALSATAWLAVHQAEVHTACVDTVPLQGCTEPGPVYRSAQPPRTRVIPGQYMPRLGPVPGTGPARPGRFCACLACRRAGDTPAWGRHAVLLLVERERADLPRGAGPGAGVRARPGGWPPP